MDIKVKDIVEYLLDIEDLCNLSHKSFKIN